MNPMKNMNLPKKPLAVWVDAVYEVEAGADGPVHIASAPAFNERITGPTRAEASRALVVRLEQLIGASVSQDQYESLLKNAGLYRVGTAEWSPRISSGDERLYIHVNPGENRV